MKRRAERRFTFACLTFWIRLIGPYTLELMSRSRHFQSPKKTLLDFAGLLVSALCREATRFVCHFFLAQLRRSRIGTQRHPQCVCQEIAKFVYLLEARGKPMEVFCLTIKN